MNEIAHSNNWKQFHGDTVKTCQSVLKLSLQLHSLRSALRLNKRHPQSAPERVKNHCLKGGTKSCVPPLTSGPLAFVASFYLAEVLDLLCINSHCPRFLHTHTTLVQGLMLPRLQAPTLRKDTYKHTLFLTTLLPQSWHRAQVQILYVI